MELRLFFIGIYTQLFVWNYMGEENNMLKKKLILVLAFALILTGFPITLLSVSADGPAPVITGHMVFRQGDTATIRFMPDKGGTCFYKVTNESDVPSDIVSSGVDGGSVTADTPKVISLSGLALGDKYVHIIVRDSDNNDSEVMTVEIISDYYYFENFESYPIDTTIASGGMSPLNQWHGGTGDSDQKVLDLDGNKMLNLSSANLWASDQRVFLDSDVLESSDSYVFEGDVYPMLDSGFQLRISLHRGNSWGASEEAGVFFNGGDVTGIGLGGSTPILKEDYTANQWHHIRIVAYPSQAKYSVYMDGVLLDDDIDLPSGINKLLISAGNRAALTVARFDNLKFYTGQPLPEKHRVTFNKNYTGSTDETYYIADGSSDFYNQLSGGSVQTLVVPTRAGYTFGGWYKEVAAQNQIISSDLSLVPNTDYTDNSSLWNSGEDVTLYAKWIEETPSNLGFDYEGEFITGLTANATYGISGSDFTADNAGKIGIQEVWFGTTVQVVKKGVPINNSFDSEALNLDIPARPNPPSGLGTVNESASGAGDGKITGVSSDMEYRLSSAVDWTSVGLEQTEINGLSGGTYLVRYSAVTGGDSPAFTSENASVAVGTDTPTPPPAPTPTPTPSNPPVEIYLITATSGEGGSISPDGSISVEKGKTKTFTIAASDGYDLVDVIVDGSSVGAVSTYTFSDVEGNHSINAVFKLKPVEKQVFEDVEEEDWFNDGVEFVVSRGLFKGTSETTFAPKVTMTRAMIVTVLWRLEGEPIVIKPSSFLDVASGMWYTDAVAWASELGIVKGYSEDAFGPDNPITREQMAAVLYRYSGYKGYDLNSSSDLSIFIDASETSDWAFDIMSWAVSEGIINGVSSTELDSDGEASRAEVAIILMRFIKNILE